ncbi:hypothetical protein N7520_009141 [Penicillium odoratum]|uniref:uncharacterized protein n=1 Tax=Penicillium odoratum TaxID=1167516 RepID=UPI002546E029|nr:uncharacterized protein N7520_009141 [Penicillium odoratum]KAJ5752224.1 hypothetical protein N7520_009141 [Penicillium odoratum]
MPSLLPNSLESDLQESAYFQDERSTANGGILMQTSLAQSNLPIARSFDVFGMSNLKPPSGRLHAA